MSIYQTLKEYNDYHHDGITLKRCPFCGSKKLVIHSPDYDGEWVLVECENCSTSGPIGESFYEAFSLWNKRP